MAGMLNSITPALNGKASDPSPLRLSMVGKALLRGTTWHDSSTTTAVAPEACGWAPPPPPHLMPTACGSGVPQSTSWMRCRKYTSQSAVVGKQGSAARWVQQRQRSQLSVDGSKRPPGAQQRGQPCPCTAAGSVCSRPCTAGQSMHSGCGWPYP